MSRSVITRLIGLTLAFPVSLLYQRCYVLQAPSQGADKSLVIAVAVPLGVALFLLLLCMRAGLVLLRRRSRSRTTLSRQGSSRQASGGLRQQQTCSSKGLDGGAYDGGEDGLSIAGGGERRGLMHRYHPRRWLSRLGKAAAHVLGIHPRSGTHKDGSDLSVSDLGSLPSQLGAYALRGLRSLTHPSNKPPGVGPDTALLLTDVQVRCCCCCPGPHVWEDRNGRTGTGTAAHSAS
jgi:hypothetical protein